MFEMVGVLFTAFTVTMNVSVALRAPSLTDTVIVVTPDWPGAGVTVIVRLAPLPAKTRLALGTRVGLAETPLTTSEAAAVSTSPTVKASGAVELF